MENKKYLLAIDQSTSGTKALLFDEGGNIAHRYDKPHKQITNNRGWVEHNPEEIYDNLIECVKQVVHEAEVNKESIVGIGLSNQRETAVVWDKFSGRSRYNAIVWQCNRGEAICKEIADQGQAESIQSRTGLPLSPYFSAAKISWVLRYLETNEESIEELCAGTMDSYLIYRLTKGKVFKTDYSNASRTQLFNILDLKWDEEIASLFKINPAILPEVCNSNASYGETDLEGYLDRPIPIHAVLGDSHGALFGQGCLEKGMVKATYGTGSSIMMNIGEKPIFSKKGIVTSLAWKIGDKPEYVLEGNINYTGAVLKWVTEDLKLISSPKESETCAFAANEADKTYLVPAFTGLGAPYWNSEATAQISGMTRITGKNEVVKAALESIAYQIADIIYLMKEEAQIDIQELRVDGGPTRNQYLMQFQSNILDLKIQVPKWEELSAIGVAYMAGTELGLYDKNAIFNNIERTQFTSYFNTAERKEKYLGWQQAVQSVLIRAKNN
ncbi:glycerol kinase [Sporanaerobium hydrogeniformans]|uniref:Glycerol kinase n=1 Tax=Sporanaerobium hydrogeniformans TaxID=3072179 RepID=A0AC61DD69_9FIRM|nr:glycerol kinase [Sporanaerobium hydrogeniformans]